MALYKSPIALHALDLFDRVVIINARDNQRQVVEPSACRLLSRRLTPRHTKVDDLNGKEIPRTHAFNLFQNSDVTLVTWYDEELWRHSRRDISDLTTLLLFIRLRKHTTAPNYRVARMQKKQRLRSVMRRWPETNRALYLVIPWKFYGWAEPEEYGSIKSFWEARWWLLLSPLSPAVGSKYRRG